MGLVEIFDRDVKKRNNGLYIEKGKGGGLIMVSVSWCGHCKRARAVLEDVSRKLGSAYQIFFINGDETEIFKVSGYPTIYYINREGRIDGQYTGERTIGSFLEGICTKSLICKK